MTSVIAVRTNSGKNAIVMASDTQLTYTKDGEERRTIGQKIFYGNDWIIASSGASNKNITKFINNLKKKSPSDIRLTDLINNAIKQERVLEVDILNSELSKDRSFDETNFNRFVLAINYPKLMMWEINIYGNFLAVSNTNDFDYLCIGSGGRYIENFIQDEIRTSSLNTQEITLPRSIELVYASIQRASKEDIATNDLVDIAILTEDRVYSYAKNFRANRVEADKIVLEEIKAEQIN